MGNTTSSSLTYPDPTKPKNGYQMIPNNATLVAALATTEGKACTFKDAIEFKFRIKQLQIISNAILALSQGLSARLPAEQIVKNAITYYDGSGNGGSQKPGYEWKLLTKDPLFYNEDGTNPFTQFDFVLAKANVYPVELNQIATAAGGSFHRKGGKYESLTGSLISASGDVSNSSVNVTPPMNQEEQLLDFKRYMVRFMNSRRNLVLLMLNDCDENAVDGGTLTDAEITTFLTANSDYTNLFTKSTSTMTADDKNKLRNAFKQLQILNHVIQELSMALKDPNTVYDADLLNKIVTYTDEETGVSDSINYPFSLLANESSYNKPGYQYNDFKEFYLFCGGTDASIPSVPGIPKNTLGNPGVKTKMEGSLVPFVNFRTDFFENRLAKLLLPSLPVVAAVAEVVTGGRRRRKSVMKKRSVRRKKSVKRSRKHFKKV